MAGLLWKGGAFRFAKRSRILAEKRPRLASVDALRGFVMIVMALDHVRDFFHVSAMSFSPEDLSRTTAVLFLTRWITHICAPLFMFTAGLGAFFRLNRGGTKAQLSHFLWTRGLWLVLLDVLVVHLAFNFNFNLHSGPVIVNVLWALGWCMVILAVLIYLPIRVLAPLSIAVIALHNLADSVDASRFGALAWIWNVVHQNGAVQVDGVTVVFAYPLVPWFAVMAAGFCFGPIFNFDPERRRRWMIRIGLGLTIAFLVVRGFNGYGDPQPWSGAIPGTVVLSFLRCTKYPPSLDFLLMTMGPALLLLAWLGRSTLKPANPLLVFGRVPLFFFIAHLYLAHILAIPLAFFRYGRVGFLFTPAPSMGGSAEIYPSDYGYGLGVVYVLWIAVVVLLYPVCLWFARLKERRKDWWLSYL
jgi:uncharacterized membrane protein